MCCVCVVYQDTKKSAGHELLGVVRAEPDGGDKRWVEATVMCGAGHHLLVSW